MQSIDSYNFAGKKAIIRVDFNVPLNDKFEVTDDTRIRAAIPTIKKVLAGGGAAILVSHLGRPKKNPDPKFSLEYIIPTIEKNLGVKIIFGGDCMGEEAAAKSAALKAGEVLLLENLRYYAEEEGKARGLAEDATDEDKAAAKKAVKASQKEFTKRLASYGNCYVNDAFGTAHRAHASTALIAEFFPNDKMFGYIMENEIKAIDKVLEAPEKPFTAIIGGAKVSSKITIIENLLKRVDNIIIGGGMTYTFVAAKGGSVGNSLCERDQFDVALSVLAKAKELGVNVYLEDTSVCADKFSNDATIKEYKSSEIPDGWMGMDAGAVSVKKFEDVIMSSKTILWNGPVGVFEMENFAKGSEAVANAIAKSTANGAFSLVGGGDSVACVNKFGLSKEVSYVSTGGGALLEYMEGIELPGVAAIRK